jgi:hypothetical protein
MRHWTRIVAAAAIIMLAVAMVGPVVTRAAGVADDVYTVPSDKTIVITITIGSKTIRIGDTTVTIDAGPQIINGRTFIPIRSLIDALGGKIAWDARTRAVTITMGKTTIILVTVVLCPTSRLPDARCCQSGSSLSSWACS